MSDPGGEEELDLEAMGKELDGEPATEVAETVETAEAPEQTQETEAKAPSGIPAGEIEVAGRKYPNFEAFKRSHDHLYRHSSRLEAELAKERKWGESYRGLEKAWKDDPEHFNALKKAEEAYFEAKKAGATNKEADAEAKAASGLTNVPPEVKQQLKELREWKESMQGRVAKEEFREAEQELGNEFSALRAKHKMDDATEDAVRVIMLEKAERNRIKLTAEDAYEIHLVRQNRVARTELDRTRASADTGTSTGSPASPAAKKKQSEMTDEEAMAELGRQLDGQGVRD